MELLKLESGIRVDVPSAMEKIRAGVLEGETEEASVLLSNLPTYVGFALVETMLGSSYPQVRAETVSSFLVVNYLRSKREEIKPGSEARRKAKSFSEEYNLAQYV